MVWRTRPPEFPVTITLYRDGRGYIVSVKQRLSWQGVRTHSVREGLTDDVGSGAGIVLIFGNGFNTDVVSHA